MPGFYKMNHAGLQFLGNLYKEKPEMSFAQMLPIYNKEAMMRGWRCLRSSGTIGYHLATMGLYVKHSRVQQPSPKRGLEIIELSGGARRKIMEAFHISSSNLSLTLRHKRNGKNADTIRDMAIELGGIKYNRDVEQLGGKLLSDENVPVTPVKVLDAKGNVKGVITNK